MVTGIKTIQRQKMFPDEILGNIFHICFRGSRGTGFTIKRGNETYLITARHVVQNMMIGIEDTIYYAKNKRWNNIKVKLLHVIEPMFSGGDLAIMGGFKLPSSRSKGSTSFLDYAVSTWDPGDEVYFYGFPLNLRVELPLKMNNGFPAPLIKTGTISGFFHEEDEFGNLVPTDIFVDAFGNPGFSGGPLFSRDYSDGSKLKVIGVVKSGHLESIAGNPYKTNSGIMRASSIRFVVNYINNI